MTIQKDNSKKVSNSNELMVINEGIVSNYYKFVDSDNIEKYRDLYELYWDNITYDRSWNKYNWKLLYKIFWKWQK